MRFDLNNSNLSPLKSDKKEIYSPKLDYDIQTGFYLLGHVNGSQLVSMSMQAPRSKNVFQVNHR